MYSIETVYVRISIRIRHIFPLAPVEPHWPVATVCKSSTVTSRALFLRNMVLGYECGRVFPAGLWPGSPLKEAANWLSSRINQSVETRRRYSWLRMFLSNTSLFRAPIWRPPGGGSTREAGGTVAESLVALYRVVTHQI